jgi:hypothetical protein
MAKFLKVPILDLLASGESDASGGAPVDLEDAAATFVTDGVAAGDIVHQSTDNKYFVVDVVVSETELELTALDGGTLPIPASKDYFIHSEDVASFKAAVSADKVKVVTQASTSTTTLKYGNGGNSVMTFTHVPVANDLGAEVLQDAVEKALQLHWNEVSYDISDDVEVAPMQIIGYAVSS